MLDTGGTLLPSRSLWCGWETDGSAGTGRNTLSGQKEQKPAYVRQASGSKKVFLEETAPELDLEGEEQAKHRKNSLRPGKDLPHTASSMCKATEAFIFQGAMVNELGKITSQAFPIAVQWPHRLSVNERTSKLEVVKQGRYKTQPNQPVTCFLV